MQTSLAVEPQCKKQLSFAPSVTDRKINFEHFWQQSLVIKIFLKLEEHRVQTNNNSTVILFSQFGMPAQRAICFDDGFSSFLK